MIGALVITIVNLCYSITSGTLQGMKHFFQYGMQSIMIAAGKLIFSIGLVLLGWKVYGIITALLLGTGIAIVYGVHYMKKYILHKDKESARHGIDLKEFLRYSFGTIVAQGCVIALTNGDILLVKAYFDDTQAGLYSSASVIGKIAMYVWRLWQHFSQWSWKSIRKGRVRRNFSGKQCCMAGVWRLYVRLVWYCLGNW